MEQHTHLDAEDTFLWAAETTLVTQTMAAKVPTKRVGARCNQRVTRVLKGSLLQALETRLSCCRRHA